MINPKYLSLFILVPMIVITCFIERYKYHDCKKVGHSTMYCIFNIFK